MNNIYELFNVRQSANSMEILENCKKQLSEWKFETVFLELKRKVSHLQASLNIKRVFEEGEDYLKVSARILLNPETRQTYDAYLDTLENNKSKPRIPFGSLVEMGILKPGTTLFDPKKKINAKIMVDGSIKYKESEGSIHKVAAKIMGAESYNGWTYWHCDVNGSTVVIDSLRQKFISEKQI